MTRKEFIEYMNTHHEGKVVKALVTAYNGNVQEGRFGISESNEVIRIYDWARRKGYIDTSVEYEVIE